MKLYIAGPITSNLDGYKAEFAAAEVALRAMGHDTINPAENPEEASWQAYMRVGLAQLLACDGVAMLPGWEGSRGASIEHRISQELGMPAIYLGRGHDGPGGVIVG